MTRRVIFPDPDIWTQPKETAVPDDATPTNAGDYRRAAALISHHRDDSSEGIAAIIDEAHAAGRDTMLLLATLALHELFMSELRTPAGRALLANWVQAVAHLDDAATPVWRAARVIDAYGRKDGPAINDEITAAGTDAPLMFRSVMDLYDELLPELSSPAGMDWISRRAATMSDEEHA